MLSTERTTGRTVLTAACIAIMAVTFIISGCGNDEEEFRKDRAKLKIKRVEPYAGDAETGSNDSITAPSVSEEVAVNEPENRRIVREVSYGEAEASYFDGDYKEAVELFSAYSEQNDQNPWGFYMLGLSAWKAGEYQLAEDSFNEALELDPGHVKSSINLSRVYLDTERFEEASNILKGVIEENPESSTAYHLLGRACRQRGDTGEAISAYRRAIALDNSNVWAMNNLGLIYIREGEFEKALQPLAKAVTVRDDVPVFQNNLGMALENTGHYRDAENAYAAAVMIDKGYDRAYNNLCRVELLEESSGTGEICLAALAESFIEGINSQMEPNPEKAEAVAAGTPDSTMAGPPDCLITVADADTTRVE